MGQRQIEESRGFHMQAFAIGISVHGAMVTQSLSQAAYNVGVGEYN